MSKRVLILHPTAGGYGADGQLLGLATGLDRGRYEPLVVLSEAGPLSACLERAGVECHVVPLAVLSRRLVGGRGWLTGSALWAQGARRVIRLAQRRGVDIVHSNSSILLPGHGIARRLGVAHLVHVREIYAGAGGRRAQPLWPLWRRQLLRADALACVSRAAARQFRGVGRAFVLPDGLMHPLQRCPSQESRIQLGISESAFVVAVIGRLSDWKGQDVLIRALADPALAGQDIVALLAGDAAPGQDHHERALRTLGDRLGLGERVRLLGFCDDVAPVLGAADVVVLPSRHPDALPNAALEAAAAGRAVVATAIGGQPEIVTDRVTGRLIAPDRPDQLARTLAELRVRPAERDALGRAAAREVKRRFSRERLLEQVQERYDALTR